MFTAILASFCVAAGYHCLTRYSFEMLLARVEVAVAPQLSARPMIPSIRFCDPSLDRRPVAYRAARKKSDLTHIRS